jgi:hypothetical protein
MADIKYSVIEITLEDVIRQGQEFWARNSMPAFVILRGLEEKFLSDWSENTFTNWCLNLTGSDIEWVASKMKFLLFLNHRMRDAFTDAVGHHMEDFKERYDRDRKLMDG